MSRATEQQLEGALRALWRPTAAELAEQKAANEEMRRQDAERLGFFFGGPDAPKAGADGKAKGKRQERPKRRSKS